MASSVTAADYRIRGFNIPKSFRLIARFALGFSKPRKSILGLEYSGIVEKVGAEVTQFKPGDEIYGSSLDLFGSYAEYNCLPARGPMTFKPASLNFIQAAAVPVGCRTAYHFLQKAGIKKGQKVLIYGASGSVGSYAVQLAKHFGAEVTGVCSASNREMVESIGADKVLDYNSQNFYDQLESYDIVYLAVDKWPFKLCKPFIRQGGIYVNVTMPFRSPSMIWTNLFGRFKVIKGENLPKGPETLVIMNKLIEQGKIKPIIERVFDFDEIVEAHRLADTGHKKGNVVIKIGDD